MTKFEHAIFIALIVVVFAAVISLWETMAMFNSLDLVKIVGG